MSDSNDTKHLEQKKRSKKIKKSYNLFDFVVVKQKNRKTKQISRVKVSKQIQRRGKLRKKRVTTIKKRILRERSAKRLSAGIPDENSKEDIETVIENVALISLKDVQEDTSSNLIESDIVPTLESLPSPSIQLQNNTIQHSRNFREYCNHFTTQEIKKYTELVLKDLFKFQENKFQQNPGNPFKNCFNCSLSVMSIAVKAKANKRYVVGFKEVRKFLVVKRLKLVIIAPDLERNTEIEKLIDEIKVLADQHRIPYVFSLKRRHIGYLLLKKVPVSLVGIFDYQGTTENVSQLLNLVQREKSNYNKAQSDIL